MADLELKLENIQSKFEAQKIIDSLRQGTVPKQYAMELMVGREFWLDAIAEDIDYVSQGASKIRFISASYGGGKSHFLSVVESIAIQKRFLVANIELHSREAPLDRFEIIFTKIMRSLTCGEDLNVIEKVLNNWLSSAKIYDRPSINREIRSISPSLDFQAMLSAFVERGNSNSVEDGEIKHALFGWLCGDTLSSILRKNTGVRNKITISNVSEIFGSFLKLVRKAGFSGVAIFLDEAESVTSLTLSRKRDEANQNIRKLLDNADKYEGLILIFATTPLFLEDKSKGARSYTALWDRIKTVIETPRNVRPNKRTLIIKLEPPGKSDLRKLASFLIGLHSKAYDWNGEQSFSNLELDKFINKYLTTCTEKIYRLFLRSLIGILDVLEQDPKGLFADTLVENFNFQMDAE